MTENNRRGATAVGSTPTLETRSGRGVLGLAKAVWEKTSVLPPDRLDSYVTVMLRYLLQFKD